MKLVIGLFVIRLANDLIVIHFFLPIIVLPVIGNLIQCCTIISLSVDDILLQIGFVQLSDKLSLFHLGIVIHIYFTNQTRYLRTHFYLIYRLYAPCGGYLCGYISFFYFFFLQDNNRWFLLKEKMIYPIAYSRKQ